jgi:hypothetical protein
VTFDKSLVTVDRGSAATHLAPGHPLLDVAVDLITERFDSLLQQGAVLIDETDPAIEPRTLVYLQHAVADGRIDPAGGRRVISKRFEFVEVDPEGGVRPAGWAPYLDLRPATADELRLLAPVIDGGWVRGNLEDTAVSHGVMLARQHLDEARRRTLGRVTRVAEAVRERLLTEIRHWDHRAAELRDRELAGRLPASGMNSGNARQRSEELKARLRERMADLDAQRQLSSAPPVVGGGALVVPAGLLARLGGHQGPAGQADREAAIAAVLAAERALGRSADQMPARSQGWDVESRAADGTALFIAVKTPDRGSLRLTQAETGVAANVGDRYVLALVDGGDVRYVHYGMRMLDVRATVPFGTATVVTPWRECFKSGREPW